MFNFQVHRFRGDSIQLKLDRAVDLIAEVEKDALNAKDYATAALRALGEDIKKQESVIDRTRKILRG